MTLFWLLAAPAILLALLSLAGEARRTAYVHARLRQRPASLPPASIIVPVKGHDDNLRLNLAMLAAQDYPDCEVIVTARTATDIPAGVLPSGVKVVLGRADEPATGDKIQNLMAAVKASRKQSQVLAFADSDGRVSPRWLRALVAPLAEAGGGRRHRLPLAHPRARRVLAACPRGVGCGDRPAGSLGDGGNRFVWGRFHGHPQGDVFSKCAFRSIGKARSATITA